MGRLEMSKYSAEYWKDRADEIRAIRDDMSSGEPRKIMAPIARDYDRSHAAGASDRHFDFQSIFGCHTIP
jgi:hypothetical protein